jgi:hypothetical protein
VVLAWVIGFGTAAAAPNAALLPAGTLPAEESEMGAAVTIGTGELGSLLSGAGGLDAGLEGAPAMGILFSAWGRYGLTERIEALGGAWLPISPLSVGVHGGARVRLIGDPVRDGPQLSVGASVSSFLLAPLATLSVTVPVSAGIRSGDVDVWLTPMVTATQLGLLGIGAEAGVGLQANGVPVFFAAQATDWGEAGLSAGGSVGVAFRGEM